MSNPIHEPRYQIFKEMLTAARASAGLKQSEVAERLGKPQSFVSKYERSERRLDVPEFLEVAAVLGIDVTKFLKAYQAELAKRR